MVDIKEITKNINTLSEDINKNVFVEQARKSFKEGIDTYDMSDEERAKFLAQYEANLSIGVVNSIISKAFDLVELNLRVELLNKQISTENINQDIKSQQEIAERIKNGNILYVYTYYQDTDDEVIAGTKRAGDIKTKTLNANGIGKSIYELEMDKLIQELTENKEKWDKQKVIVDNQVEMSNIDKQFKFTLVSKDVAIKEKQLSQMAADISFNESKKIIMELTRKDNIRMKSAEMFAEFLKYLSAANVIPANQDFENIRSLIIAIQQGLTSENATALIASPSGNQYVKP
ncbi:MAG: hypothetical protein PHV52_00205 [Aliarcobacter sp.]|nr:hypothetical protein [Aliarcobacter sp.]